MEHKKIGRRKFTIPIRKSAEGGYIGQCLELPGAISEAETLAELKSNMTEAITLILDAFAERETTYQKMVIEIPE